MIDENGPGEEVPPVTAELLHNTDLVTLRMPRQGWTFEDLLRTPEDGRRWEIVEGSLHVSASPRPPHQIAASRIEALLLAAAPAEVEVMETVDIDFGGSVLEPDVLVVRADEAYAGRYPFRPEDVLLAVEVRIGDADLLKTELLAPAADVGG